MITKIKNMIYCARHGHDWKRAQATLGGVWIVCRRCDQIDEYLPGLHEPRNVERMK